MAEEFLEMIRLDETTGLRPIIDTNLEKLEEGLKVVDNEVYTSTGRIDTLAIDKTKNPVVIEYKTSQQDEALIQALDYANWLNKEQDTAVRIINRKFGNDFVSIETLGDARIILIAPSFSERLINASKLIEPNIKLFECLSFKGNKIMIKEIRSEGTRPLSKQTYSIDEKFEGNYAAMKPVFEKLRRAVESFGPDKPEIYAKMYYIGIKRKHMFAVISVFTTRLDIHFKLNVPHEDARLEASEWTGFTNAVSISKPEDVDEQLIAWLKESYKIQDR